MNTEYYITPVPLLPSQCPVFVSRKYGQPNLCISYRCNAVEILHSETVVWSSLGKKKAMSNCLTFQYYCKKYSQKALQKFCFLSTKVVQAKGPLDVLAFMTRYSWPYIQHPTWRTTPRMLPVCDWLSNMFSELYFVVSNNNWKKLFGSKNNIIIFKFTTFL
jgi:hypothetical protein